MMRTKDNDYRARYYTNEAIRRRVDMRLKKMHRLTPLMDATDVTTDELTELNKEMERLNGEIKEIDSEFWDEINLISAVS
jgi:predicted  nucleic acid-binding Zn-ribbon protein